MVFPIASMFSSSVARGVSSTASSPSAAASRRNASMKCDVYSRSATPAFCDSAMMRSSTSVKFIT
jgi:hypothetical protein